MEIQERARRRRPWFLAVVSCVGLLIAALAAPLASGQSSNVCDQPGEAPDLLVGDITSRTRWGSSNGVTAFSFGMTPCNTGSCWANWFASTPEHPVIGQSLYRLRSGRFE